jgi:hypothetical protein
MPIDRKTLVRAFWICFTVACVFFLGGPALPGQQKNLDEEQQAAFLAKRTSGGISGTFDSVCSTLYAFKGVAIHTESSHINQTALNPASPKFYEPTWRELFDSIARQTKSTWKYDPVRGYWVFAEPQKALPYKLQLAAGWQPDDHGIEMVYRPPIAPVGMDIYWMGAYSSDTAKEAAALSERVRNELAVLFARDLKKEITVKEMSVVAVGKADALYFQGVVPSSGVTWRQWVLVSKGQAFAIVSAIKPEHEKKRLPDVQAMVNSFEIIDEPTQ